MTLPNFTDNCLYLRDNLSEIYYAVNRNDCKEGEVVANWSGTRIYDATCRWGWGRLWRCLYSFISFFTRDRGLQANTKLAMALRKTENVFQACLANIKEHVRRHQEYEKEIIEGKSPVVIEEIYESRRLISRWNDCTQPLLEFVNKDSNGKLRELFIRCLNGEDLHVPFIPDETYTQAWKCQPWIDFEMKGYHDLPITQLRNVAAGKTLNETDQQVLKAYFSKINADDAFPIRPFLKRLENLLPVLESGKTEEVMIYRLAEFAIKLQELGCRVFDREDPEQLIIRSHLHEGYENDPGDRHILLGSRIESRSRPGDGRDHHVVFNVSITPSYDDTTIKNWVIISGCNSIFWAIQLAMEKQMSTGFLLHPATIYNVNPRGKFAIVEKLDALEEWKFANGQMTAETEEVLKLFAEVICECRQKNVALADMHFENMMLGSNHDNPQEKVLRTKKMLPCIDFSFTYLEKFVQECARGHLQVYKYLMKQSTLSQHRYQNFFNRVVQLALEKGDTLEGDALRKQLEHLESLAGAARIQDDFDQAEQLYNDIVELKERCGKSSSDLLNERILRVYEENGSGTILWDGMEDQINSAMVA